MKFTSCMSLILAANQNPVFIPETVQELSKKRLSLEYKRVFPERTLKFDTNECSFEGKYFFTPSEIVIEAENPFWQGKKSYPIGFLIEGRELNFPALINSYVEEKSKSNFADPVFKKEYLQTRSSENHGLYWILAALTLGSLSLLIIDSTSGPPSVLPNESRQSSAKSKSGDGNDPWGRVKNF